MKSLLKKSAPTDPNLPLNDKDPIRIAFLGGPKTGKSGIISKLTSGSFSETYYPLRNTLPILFEYAPSTDQSVTVLDQSAPQQTLNWAMTTDQIVLSPVVYQSLVTSSSKAVSAPLVAQELESGELLASNDVYASFKIKTPEGSYKKITPILTELIDTPSFNTNHIVPFLEASLYIKLDRDVLHNLADEPRRPVNTNPLLVASGAGEMNGAVDGYFFVYTAVPSKNPPAYDEAVQAPSSEDITPYSSTESYNDNGTLRSVTMHKDEKAASFNLLPIMKDALDEAWREYYTYKMRWNYGEEGDVFSFKSALKNMWTERDASKPENPISKLKLLETPMDPADPACPPPIWIICTNCHLPLASPKLIEDGKRLAKLWKCGFIALDLTDNIEDTVALMVRDLVERKRIQKNRKRKMGSPPI